jgi:hypothetical protein
MEINISGWLNAPYEQNSIVWIIITAIISLLFGFLASWLSFYFIRKNELVAEVAAEIKKHEKTLDLDEEHEREERIHQEVIRWSNPILIAVSELCDRLENIISRAYVALDENFEPKPRWPMTYEYFMNTTLFLFGQYFAWTRIMEEEISYEIFSSEWSRTELFEKINNFSWA